MFVVTSIPQEFIHCKYFIFSNKYTTEVSTKTFVITQCLSCNCRTNRDEAIHKTIVCLDKQKKQKDSFSIGVKT